MPTFEGQEIVQTARKHKNEKYVLGSKAPLANKDWKGPWDCAEFVSWCAYQAYQIIYAVRPANPVSGESYSGWWFDDGKKVGIDIPVEQAIATEGAILVRKPNYSPNLKIGHVAISLGDGGTIEAKDKANGVLEVKGASNRPWSLGILLPGVKYKAGAAGAQSYKEPANLLYLDSPYMRGAKVKALQQALVAKGVFPGKVDSIFGPLTSAAVVSFQALEGLVPDGMVGDETRTALGLP
jgi:hypothetical protein